MGLSCAQIFAMCLLKTLTGSGFNDSDLIYQLQLRLLVY